MWLKLTVVAPTGADKATSSLFSWLTSSSVTSRLKGAHTRLKAFLQVSTGDLFNVVRNIKNLIKNEINNHTITLAKHQDRPPHNVREPEFDDILYKVTPQCLRHLKAQLKLTKSPNYQPIYSGAWTAVYGLPYCHTLYRQLHRSATSILKIQLTEINEH